MEIVLVVLGTKANKKEVRLKLPATIGRSRNATLTVAHPMISRKHCELSQQDGVVILQDLGSLNGTIVDGELIGKTELPPGRKFSIGPIIFQTIYERPDDSPAPPSSPALDAAEVFAGLREKLPEEKSPPADQEDELDLVDPDEDMGLVELESESTPPAIPLATPSPPNQSPDIPVAKLIQGGVPSATPIQGGVPTAMPIQGGVPTAMPVNPPGQGSHAAKSESLTDTDLDDFLNGFQP